MHKIEWCDAQVWDINEEIVKAVKETAFKMGEAELQKIRDKQINIFEVTYSLKDLGIDSSIKLEEVWDYIQVPHTEVGHFVIASDVAELYHNGGRKYAEAHHGRPYMFNYDNQTITVLVIVVDRRQDIMALYSDDEGYGWVVPLKDYPTADALVREEANFNNGSCIIVKRGNVIL